MSKARNNIPRAAIHVGAPAKSFSAAEGYEPERRRWDEKTYRLKNQDTNNHYDFTRKHLNFEINSEGKIVPLGSNPIPLHERLQKRLDELGFKPYKDKDNPLGNADNSPNCTVGIIVSGDHDVLARLAFGDQDVDFTLQKSNAHVVLKQGIKDWALDTYDWACRRWGAENIIGFDVHLDETTPHIQIQTIPVAKTKARGRASVKYVHKDDKSKQLSQKEWKKLSEEIRNDFVRTEVERREKKCVSYARVWGEDKYAVGRTYYQMHTDYYNQVGRKYGLERGDDIAMLPGEEQRERVHKNKAVLEAERQAKESLDHSQAEMEALEQEKDKIENETRQVEQRKERVEGKLTTLEKYAEILDIKQEDLVVPTLKTNPLVKKSVEAIQAELEKPIPAFGQKEWREERMEAVKKILTDLQTALFDAKEAQKQDILKLGKSLYQKAMKDAKEIIVQNRQLQKANERLTAENAQLKKKISTIDETAVSKLRKQKNDVIAEFEAKLNKAYSEATRSDNIASIERQRADKAERQVKDMMAVPEIKEIWDAIQQNKRAFWQQVDGWINDARKAIYAFAKDYEHSIFTEEYTHPISWGIMGQALKGNLDASDKEQRMTATHNLLGQISWKGTTDLMSDLAQTRTKQLCEEMTVTKDMMKNLLLAAGGRGGISTGGGGSNNELTNWDGTKKKNGWGVS